MTLSYETKSLPKYTLGGVLEALYAGWAVVAILGNVLLSGADPLRPAVLTLTGLGFLYFRRPRRGVATALVIAGVLLMSVAHDRAVRYTNLSWESKVERDKDDLASQAASRPTTLPARAPGK